MFNNPLIQRYRFSLMRPRQFGIYVGIYLTVAVLMLLITVGAYTGHGRVDLVEMSQSLFAQFMTLQILILWIWTSINVGSTIREEIRDKSYDFFKLLPLPPSQKAIGILVGKNLVAYLLAGATLVFTVPASFGASVPWYVLCEILFLLVSVSVCMNLLALLVSITQPMTASSRATSPLLIVFLGFTLIGPFIGVMASLLNTSQIEGFTIPFMAGNLRGLPLIGAIAVYLSAWCFCGVCRQFRVERAPLFTPRGAVGFTAGALFILLGFFWPHLSGADGPELCLTFWLVSLGLAILISAGAYRRFDTLLEMQAADPQARPSLVRFTLTRSNLVVAMGLLLLGIAVGLPCGIYAHIPWNRALIWLLSLASFGLLYALLIELQVVYRPVNAKVHILLAFLGILYAILPLILGGVFESEHLVMYSPLGYFAVLCDQWDKGAPGLNPVGLVNLLLCVPAFLLVRVRYKVILAGRD
jgi:hypothetical protein